MDFIPLIMWLILFSGIIVLTSIRFNRLFNGLNEYPSFLDIIFISLYLLWMIIELRVTKKDLHADEKKLFDRMTCQIYGTAQALTILTALWFPSVWRVMNAAHFMGIGIFLFGVFIRIWAIKTLGQFYSHRVRTVSEHQIVSSGPYSAIRHPAYAGMIIANAGISVYFCNWVTICIFLLLLIPAIIFRIVVEEKSLFEIEGYGKFACTRKRLFPAIW